MQEATPKTEEEYVPIGHAKQAVPSAYSPAAQVTEQSATSIFLAAPVVFPPGHLVAAVAPSVET